jgi:hypothetical protein
MSGPHKTLSVSGKTLEKQAETRFFAKSGEAFPQLQFRESFRLYRA